MTLAEIYHKKENFAVRKQADEMVMVPVKNNVADMNVLFTLNETACFIWEQIDGKNIEEDIVEALLTNFDTDELTARADLKRFLDKLEKYMQ